MRNRAFAASLAVLFIVFPSPARAAAPATEISVSGQGAVTLAPDQATVDASIANNDSSADRAVSQNNATYAAVVARLAQTGVKKERIQTTFFNVSFVPPPEEVAPGPGNVRPRPPAERYGYIANRGLSITVSDVKAAGRVIDALVANANVTVGNVAFGIRDRRNAYRAALTRAVNDAQTQAQTLASAAHLRIVRLKSMQEGYVAAPPVPLMRTMAATAAVAPPTEISPGSVNVSATVTLVYEAVP
jgi:uncharacterized protein YggE